MKNPFDLTGLRAVVTGGNRGLGAGIALGLAQAGADIVSIHRNPEQSKVALEIQALGRKYNAVHADLGEMDRLELVIQKVLELGVVDILVNNAGINIRHPAAQFPLSDWDMVMNVNLKSVFVLAQGFGREMLERKRGKIINIASLLSFQGGLTVPAYAASKGGVAQLTKALSNEWAAQGVNVNAVAPGAIVSEAEERVFGHKAAEYSQWVIDHQSLKVRIEPEAVAELVLFLVSPASDMITGQNIAIDGGW